MKIWLDDIRDAPDETWTIARSVPVALDLISENVGQVDEISLDHDLGDYATRLDGIDLLNILEQLVGTGELRPVILPKKFSIHSANPVGRANMMRAITSIERFREEK